MIAILAALGALALILLLAALPLLLSPLSEEELIDQGIVPANKRYDRDFVARCRRALGEDGR